MKKTANKGTEYSDRILCDISMLGQQAVVNLHAKDFSINRDIFSPQKRSYADNDSNYYSIMNQREEKGKLYSGLALHFKLLRFINKLPTTQSILESHHCSNNILGSIHKEDERATSSHAAFQE